jgi:hypothetical protein
MMKVPKVFLCVGMASILLIGLAELCFAEPNQTNGLNERREGPMPHEMAGHPMRGPIEVLHSGCGFALRDNESHVLRLNVESLLPIEPGQIRMHLASNKSLEEIKDDILAKIGEATYRGSLMLEGSVYSLVNIKVNPVGNNSTSVEADMTDPEQASSGNETVTFGSISIIISPTDGSQVGKGDLELNRGQQKGKYIALLDMRPSRGGNCPMPYGK